jgi:hypothetical protein
MRDTNSMPTEHLPPIRSVAKDEATGKVGEIMDYEPTGALEPRTVVLRPEGGGLEWRTQIENLVPLPGWMGRVA